MTKALFCLIGNFIGRNKFTVNNVGVTNDGESFSFPTNTPVNHLMSVRVSKESCYDDVNFKFKVKLTNVTASSRVGILLKSATDGYDGERPMFVLGDGKISFYYNNTKQVEYANFDITQFNNKSIILEMRRSDDSYHLIYNGQTYSRRFLNDGTVFRQNVNPCVYGSGISVEIERVYMYTQTPEIEFGILGDSIANGYSTGSASGWEKTIKGINELEHGLSIGEFAGSANVIKDSLDSFHEIAIVRPKYCIIQYGHNDVLFGTGRLQSDYIALVAKLKVYGIIPVICALPYSAWIDIDIPNTFIVDTYFNEGYTTIDLRDTLIKTAPGPDYADIAHPNVQGNRKLAEAYYDILKDLP